MKIVIIGGVAGGASAAARARRHDEKAEIILLQSGPDISYASCGMPYFIGGEIKNRHSMAVQTPASLYAKLRIDVRVNVRVTAIDTEKKEISGHNERTSDKFSESYDELILAVGAAPLKPPIPGIDLPSLFSLRNLEDMDNINHWIAKTQDEIAHHHRMHCYVADGEKMHVVVAGAGFIGLEMVEQLLHRNIQVSLVEMMPQILGPLDVEMANILEQDLIKRGVNVITGDGIKQFEKMDECGDVVVHLASGKKLPAAQMTILGLGVRPDTAIVREAGIACTKRGHIIVDEYLKTNTEHVWAVGDAVEVKNPIVGGQWAVPLAGPANRQGRMAADNIYGKNRKFKGTYAAAVVRSFDLIAAAVGMNEKMLRAQRLPYNVVHVHPGSHAGYYPGAKSINLKVLFNPEDGKIYGAQAVGEDGVEKRIDVISTAMQGGLTAEDLAELELCYAPPVGSAKDPVNIAGMAAQNIMDGFVKQIQWDQLEDAQNDPDTVILDVRNPGEVTAGELVNGALQIPLPELRDRLGEVPTDKKIVVSCASGQRAYYACRILQQTPGLEGKVFNLSGAFKTFKTTPTFLSRS
ncbi:A disulfide reductase [Seminavis robusta]|uniref:A disulfide reductase n=2 Tax=Seminavis robusta TaxID=568900 RepID=A0A9N8HZS3_9STRA|nr:A disulfide reductase [Seminavis robusta]|eukprot:Sro2365_g325050.1 A disulfide reductase (578) ;mRNA; r:9823-11556